MDQLHDDVASLAVSYQRQAPSSVVGQLASTQDSIFTLIEGRQPVSHTHDLLLLAGMTTGLLAKVAHDLGDPRSALTHSRAAYLCADNAQHNGMRAWIRGLQSLIAYWAGRHHDAIRYAQQGALVNPTGSAAVWLPLGEARAWAALGNVAEVQAALTRAEAAREKSGEDDLDRIGGLFTFSRSRELYYGADALAWLPGEHPLAERRAEEAVAAYADTSAPDWAFGDAAGSSADLALARLRRGEVEGAVDALDPVLDLPADQRINGILASVAKVYDFTTSMPESSVLRTLQERIETFSALSARTVGS